MSKTAMHSPLQRSVRWSRRAQHIIDILLCLGLLATGMFAIHWNTQAEQTKTLQTTLNTASANMRPATVPTPTGQAVQWQQPIDTNSNALAAFDTWRVTQHIAQGHCQLRPNVIDCVGIQLNAFTPIPASFENLSILKTGKTTASEKPFTAPEAPSIKQEGWVQTPHGKRYFNPRTERWVK